jgi:hypothetical protein
MPRPSQHPPNLALPHHIPRLQTPNLPRLLLKPVLDLLQRLVPPALLLGQGDVREPDKDPSVLGLLDRLDVREGVNVDVGAEVVELVQETFFEDQGDEVGAGTGGDGRGIRRC